MNLPDYSRSTCRLWNVFSLSSRFGISWNLRSWWCGVGILRLLCLVVRTLGTWETVFVCCFWPSCFFLFVSVRVGGCNDVLFFRTHLFLRSCSANFYSSGFTGCICPIRNVSRRVAECHLVSFSATFPIFLDVPPLCPWWSLPLPFFGISADQCPLGNFT